MLLAELDIAAVFTSIAAIIMSLATLLGAAVGAYKLWHRDERTDKRVDLLWTAHMRRGQSEGLSKGMILPVPPRAKEPNVSDTFTVTPEVRASYEPIAAGLKQMWVSVGKGQTEGQFAELVEARYGIWLATFICPVLGISDFACLQIARLVAMETAAPAWAPTSPGP